MRVLSVVCLGLVVFGCSKPASTTLADVASAPQEARSAPAEASSAKARNAAAAPASVAMLAYSYDYGLRVPADRLQALMAKHENACAAAGPEACQVTGGETQQRGTDGLHATLSLRATPAWLATFRRAIPGDAAAAGGRVIRSATSTEDLSRQIVDSEAAVRAKTALRDRLQQILQTRPGKISELVEVETKLSDVQGELDTMRSELAAVRERIATSKLTIDYASNAGPVSEGAWAPLGAALHDFVAIVVYVLAVMVRVFAVLLPCAVVIGIPIWFARRRMSKRPSKSPSRPTLPDGA
jgi:hypothetical protein